MSKQVLLRAPIVFIALIAAVFAALLAHNQTLTMPVTTTASHTTRDTAVHLDVAPGAFGPNRFLLSLRDTHNSPIEGASVHLELQMTDMPMGLTKITAQPVGDGRYQALTRLSMPGHWRIQAYLLGPSLPQNGITSTFRIVASASSHAPVPTALPLTTQQLPSLQPTLSPSAIRWPHLPYRAAVSFVDNGLLYLPGSPQLLSTGRLNHTVTSAPDGTLWTTDYMDGRVAIIDPKHHRLLAYITTGIGPVHVAFTPDGRRAFVANFLSNDVTVINVLTRRVMTSIHTGMQPHGLAISPDGRQLWVPCGGAGGLWVIDTRTNRLIHTYPAGIIPHAVAFSPDGHKVYMTDAGPGDLVVLDQKNGVVEMRIAYRTGSAMVAVSADGHRVYVTGQNGSILTVIDTAAKRIIARVPVGGAPHGLALTPDGRYVYVAANTGQEITIVATASYKVVAQVPMPGTANELALVR